MYITNDKHTDYNFTTNENNARITNFSSQTKGCPVVNVLSKDRKSIWLSETTMPQFFHIDIGNLIRKPKSHFQYFGIYCWHAYSTNPKFIELQFSRDNKNYLSFGKYEIELRPGIQCFEIRNNKLLENNKFRYVKVIVRETFGGNKTYLNQIYFFETFSNNPSTSNSNKITQISDKRKEIKESPASLTENENDQNSIIENESIADEEETLQAPTEMERSKLMKDKINHNLLKRNLEYKNNLSAEENIEESTHNSHKLKARNKMLINKGDITSNGFREPKRESIRRSASAVIVDRTLYDSIDKNNEENRSNTHETKNSIKPNNKINNNSFAFEDNDYLQLEYQLRDMEDHLKSMGANIIKETSSKTFNPLTHSKSFSFINSGRDFNSSSNLFNYNKIEDKDKYQINVSSPELKILGSSKINDYLNFDLNSKEIKNANYNSKVYDNNFEVRLEKLENKLEKFEHDLSDLKVNFQTLINNMNKLIDGGLISNNFTNNKSDNIYSKQNEIVSLILNECNRMINEKLSNNQNTKSFSKSSRNTDHNKHLEQIESNISTYEEKLNKKIEQKFESLSNNIESNIYNNLLKPSINTIEKTMEANFGNIKNKIQTINNDININTNRYTTDSVFDNELRTKSISVKYLETDREKKLDSKLEEISTLGGKLYEKLLEKEKKLTELKHETTSYLKKKLQKEKENYNYYVKNTNTDSNLESLEK